MSDNITLPRKHIDYAAHALEHFNKDAPDPLVSEIIHHLRIALAAPIEDIEALRRDAERDEAVKAEREACAKVCEDEAAKFRSQKEGCRDARYDWKEDAAMECSLAIRSRGEVQP